MKKILLGAVLVGLLAAPAVFAETERGFVSSTATANKELAPDTVEISIAVVTYDNKSMQKATLENKELSDKLYNAMKGLITPANGDWVKTSDFRAQPVYSYSGNKRNFDKYEVSNRIIVHTKSIDKAGDIIDKAITLGATNIDNLNFTLSSYEKECDELLSVATKRARTQADSIVKAAGSSITGVKSISGSCSPNASTRVTYRNMMLSAKAADSAEAVPAYGAATPIEVGAVKIYANVNASFFVK